MMIKLARIVEGILLIVQLVDMSYISVRAAGYKPVSCLDDDGSPTDWAIVYKLPVMRKSEQPFRSGWAYSYMTSEQVGEKNRPGKGERSKRTKSSSSSTKQSSVNPAGWTISEKLLKEENSLIMRTLDQVYKNPKLSSVFYSDQPPEKNIAGAHRAHAKGVLVLDEVHNRGFWLTHTVPRFPLARNGKSKNEFFHNSRIYAQTFMCISFNLDKSAGIIIKHLVNLRPPVYDSQLSGNLLSTFPPLNDLSVDALKGRRLSGFGEDQMAQMMVTRKGERLSLYSQSGDARKDMYGWLKRELGANLFVESWQNGVGKLESSCPANQFKVNNIRDLRMFTKEGKELTWTYRQDHSKWAIVDDEESGQICLSDVNRMQSQFKRGGGSVCIRCPACWRAFSRTIADIEACPVSRFSIDAEAEDDSRASGDDDSDEEYEDSDNDDYELSGESDEE